MNYDDLLAYRKSMILADPTEYNWNGDKFVFGLNLKAGLPQGAAPSTVLSLLALSD
jgi:hypothetical protein